MKMSKPVLIDTCRKLYQSQDWLQLLDVVERAIKQKRGNVDALVLNMAGAAARAVGDRTKAERYWLKAYEKDPINAHVLNNLGIVYRETGRLDTALEYFKKAVAVTPTATFLNNIGVLYYNLRRFNDAVAAYKQAVEIDPQYADAWANLGNSLKDLHQPVQAEKAYEKALAIKPDSGWALSCMAHIQQKLTNQDKAIEYAERARALEPENAEIQLTALNTMLPLRPETEQQGAHYVRAFSKRLDELYLWAKQGVRLKNLGERVGYSQPYFIAYRKGNHKDVLSRYGRLMTEAVKEFRPHAKISTDKWSRSRKIRICIISGFVFRHSVWDVILKGVVLNLNRDNFELAIFHTGATIDDQTAIARERADKFIQGPHTHDVWLNNVVDYKPDVLFYPEIGMDPYAMHLASLRLAPLQMTSWGHPMTSGLPTLDWYLSGELLEPIDAQDHYSEKLIRLPGTGVCTYQLEIQPRKLTIKHDIGISLDKKVKVYLCQHAFKYTDEAIKLIGRIATELPEIVFFVVKDSKYPDAFKIALNQMRDEFKKSGVDYDAKVFLLPWMNRAQFLGSFEHVDIYLDLPGFSGYTTAWQALGQGIPVVTLEGNFLRQRLAAGLLRAVASEDCIATNEDEYINIVGDLSSEVIKTPHKHLSRRLALKHALSSIDSDNKPVFALQNIIIDFFTNHSHEEYPEEIISSSGDGKLFGTNHSNHIYIAQLSDIKYLYSIREKISGKILICTDPYIMEMASSQGLKDVQLRRLHVSEDFQQGIVTEAYSRAIAMDRKLDRIRREVFSDIPHPGWDAQLYSMFLMRALTFREYAKPLGRMLNSVDRCSVVAPSFPQHLYFDSCISTSILIDGCDKLECIAQYDDSRIWRNDFNDWTFNFSALQKRIKDGKLDAIVHIPTCFHQKEYFSKYIQSRYEEFADLPSLLWDVPVRRSKDDLLVPWRSQINDNLKVIVDKYSNAVVSLWERELLDVVRDSNSRALQVNFFKDRAALQAATYLCGREVLSKDVDFVTSDHDLGLLGPLFSLAKLKGLKTFILPHSTILQKFAFLPHGDGVTLIQGESRRERVTSVMGDDIHLEVHPSIRTPLISHSKNDLVLKKTTVCLLLNSLYSTGMSYVDLFEIRAVYIAMSAYCIKNDLELFVRPKPGGAAPVVLAHSLDLPIDLVNSWTVMPIAEVVARTDICVCYGEETSALSLFEDSDVSIVCHWSQCYPSHYWTSAEIDHLRTKSVDQLIDTIDRIAVVKNKERNRIK
jgi:protein O-GlcNAc transferase